jgi:hypothetical protein
MKPLLLSKHILCLVMAAGALLSANAQKITVQPNDNSVRYFGKWQTDSATMKRFTESVFSSAYFTFRGKYVQFYAETGKTGGKCEIILDGAVQKTFDTRAETAAKTIAFEKNDLKGDRIHYLVVKLLPDSAKTTRLVVLGFDAEKPIDYRADMKLRMEKEYAVISNHLKPIVEPEHWNPVPYRATMPEHGVRLTNGIVRELFDSNIDNLKYCFSLPDYCEGGIDKSFPEDEQKPGWAGWLPASNEGRMLGGAAGALCWEENPYMQEIVDKIIFDIKQRTRSDGFFNYYPENRSYTADHWMHPKDSTEREDHNGGLSERKNYDRVFWTRGMLAAMRTNNPDAPQLLRGMYDWFNRQDHHLAHILIGGNATNGTPGGPLVYHSRVGKPDDIITNMRYFDQDYWYSDFADRQPMVFSHYTGERPHCYDLLPVESIADEYRATGDPKYLDQLLGAWEVYYRYYKHTGGTTAICESGGPYPPESYYVSTGHTGETCGSVFWAWINERLAQLYPEEEKYIAQIEEAIFNTLCNCRDQKGYTRYHINLHAKKENSGNYNSCCQVASTIAISSIPKYIFMTDDISLYVNLLIASTFDSPFGKITLDTDFPKTSQATLTIHPKNPNERFNLKIRIPCWAAGDVKIFVNGKQAGKGKAGQYFTLNRKWKWDDRVTFTVTTDLRLVRYTGADQSPDNQPRYTLLYGPILMALDGCNAERKTIPQIGMKPEKLLEALRAAKTDSLHFPVPNTDWTFMPYSDAGEKGFTCLPVVN